MPTIEGWGTGPWGPMPWGGVVIPDEVPAGIAGWGPGSRFEKVSRERRREREQEEIRNVIFRVSGLQATGKLGEPAILGGYGRAVQLRGFRRCHGALGAVEVYTDVFPTPSIAPALCYCGEAKVLLITEPRLNLPARSRGELGKPNITAQRNLSDDELIHMIAEML